MFRLAGNFAILQLAFAHSEADTFDRSPVYLNVETNLHTPLDMCVTAMPSEAAGRNVLINQPIVFDRDGSLCRCLPFS